MSSSQKDSESERSPVQIKETKSMRKKIYPTKDKSPYSALSSTSALKQGSLAPFIGSQLSVSAIKNKYAATKKKNSKI